MVSFPSLPVELQRQCAHYLDMSTLKSLRLVSQEIALSIGTEELFETVILKFNAESAERFKKLLEKEAIRPLVKRIVIEGQDGDMWKEKLNNYPRDRTETPWSLAIGRFSDFPSLKEVEISFNEECQDDLYSYLGLGAEVKQGQNYRQFYHDRFFPALGDAELVDSLTIRHIQDLLIAKTGEGEGFTAARGRLKKLALMIATENETAAPETNIEKRALSSCFNTDLPRHWLEPTQNQLTHLSIFCESYWGTNPWINIRDVHFDHLKSLALGNYTIAADWQIDWITSHGETLEQLILDDCPIVYAIDTADADFEGVWPEITTCAIIQYATRWSDVFILFREKLKHLRHFGIGHGGENIWAFDHRYELPARIQRSETSYIVYAGSQGPSPWVDNPRDNTTTVIDDLPRVMWEDYDDGYTEIKELDDHQYDKDEQALNALLESIGKTKAEIERMKRLKVAWGGGWEDPGRS